MSQSSQIKDTEPTQLDGQFPDNLEASEGADSLNDGVVKVTTEPRKTSLATNAVKGAAAFSKSIAILQMIADSEQPPSISMLVRQSNLPRPTLHRLLKALAAEDMVELRPNKTYAVGARTLQLAGRALAQNDLAKIAAPEMSLLSAQTQETVHLAIRSSNDLVYIYKKDTPHALPQQSAREFPATRVPLVNASSHFYQKKNEFVSLIHWTCGG